jgi:hypothetical protein
MRGLTVVSCGAGEVGGTGDGQGPGAVPVGAGVGW